MNRLRPNLNSGDDLYCLSSFLLQLNKAVSQLCDVDCANNEDSSDKSQVDFKRVLQLRYPLSETGKRGKELKNPACDIVLHLQHPRFDAVINHLAHEAACTEVVNRSCCWSLTISWCCYLPNPRRLEIHLSRTFALQRIINDVVSNGKEYGNRKWPAETREPPLILVTSYTTFKHNKSNDYSLSELRTIYIIESLLTLLTANGFRPLLLSSNSDYSAESESEFCHTFYINLSPFRTFATTDVNCTDDCCVKKWKSQFMVYGVEKESSVGIRANKFLADNESNIQGYEKTIDNIYLLKDAEVTDVCKYACRVDESAKALRYVIHVSNYKDSYTEQQCGVLCQMVTPCRHLFVIHQDATCSDKDLMARDYYLHHVTNLESAFLQKNGKTILDKEEQNSLSVLATSRMVFEMLSTSLSVKCKVDHVATENGTFVQYNCSRLAMLFHRYEELVKNGEYPPLPPVDCIDFSFLKLEEEWHLVSAYLMQYPILIQELVESLLSCSSVKTSIPFHRLCRFLVNLSNTVSVYYSKTRVLTSPLPHLLPTMFARLWLLRAVQQVMHNGMSLMNLKTVKRM